MSATDSRLDDHQIRQQLPLPVAAAWHRVMLASGPEARVQRALATFEIALRCVGTLLVADYLAREPVPSVETALEKLARPHLGDWMAVVRETARLTLDDEATFLPEAGRAWFTTKGKPNATLKAADALVALRNNVQHGRIAPGSAAWGDVAQDAVTGVRGFLGSLAWLRGYRLLRVLEQTPTRRRTTRGLVQLYVGSQAHPEPVVAEWDAALLPDAIYLVGPGGDRVLEVSPFYGVQSDPKTEEDGLFLFRGVHRSGEILLGADETGSTVRVRAQGERGLVSWAEWLESRALREPSQPNLDVLRTLRAPVRESDRSGEMLADRFEVLGLLGTGGMATVHHVRDHLSDEECALKILHPELAGDPVFRTRFTREVATVRDVNHPNVLAHVELGSLPDGELYMRMPLLPGGTVADRISNGPIEPGTARRWAEQLLSALAYLESVNVLHRDVKPSNLLLDAQDDLVLSDFGIALGEEDARLTRTLQQMGSLAYMAPESRGAAVEVSAKADVYSAALVLHELLAGEPPAAIPGHGLSGDLADVIGLMGTSDPGARPTAAEALAMLEDPAQLPANAPLPSDDGTIAVAGAAVALASGALFFVPAVTVIPASSFADWPTVPAGLAWLSWLVAVAMPLVGGAWAARRAHGSALKAGALAGALGLASGYAVTGSTAVCLLASSTVIRTVIEGAHGVDSDRMSLLISEPLIGGAWGSWGGLWVAALLGGALGAAGSLVGSAMRTTPEGETIPNDDMRTPILVETLLMNATVLAVVQVAVVPLHKVLRETLTRNEQVGVELLIVGLTEVVALTIATFVLIPAVVMWPTVKRQWHVEHDGKRPYRSSATLVMLVGIAAPLGAALALWSTPGSGSSPLIITALCGAPIAGLAWFVASPPPKMRKVRQPSGLRLGLEASAAQFLVFPTAMTPVVFGWVGAVITIEAIAPLTQGYPAPAEMRFGLESSPMLVLVLTLTGLAFGLGALPLSVGLRFGKEPDRPWAHTLRDFGLLALGWAPSTALIALVLLGVQSILQPDFQSGTQDLPTAYQSLSTGHLVEARAALDELAAEDRALADWTLGALEGDVRSDLSDVRGPAAVAGMLEATTFDVAQAAYPGSTPYAADLVATTTLAWAGAMLDGPNRSAAADDLLYWRPRAPLAHLLHLRARVDAEEGGQTRLEIADEVYERAHEWAADQHPWLVAEHAWLQLVEGEPLEAWMQFRELDPEDWDHPELAPVALAVALAVDDPELRQRAEFRLVRPTDRDRDQALSWRGAQRVAIALARADLGPQALAFLDSFPRTPRERQLASELQQRLEREGIPAYRQASSFGAP